MTGSTPTFPRSTPARRRRGWAAVVVALLGASTALVAQPASAGTMVRGHGYVWADRPSSALGTSYQPALAYQYNSTGARNTVTRTDTGQYVVRFPNIGPFGTVLVTAYGTTAGRADDRCKVNNWYSSTTGPWTDVTVRCFTRTGAPADSRFTAAYTSTVPAERATYLFNDRASAPVGSRYTPRPAYQYNSTGGTDTIVREGVGSYRVRLAGLGWYYTGGRNMHVRAYGSTSADPATHCSMTISYKTTPDGDYGIDCRDSLGRPADSRFVLTYIEGGNHLFAPMASHETAVANVVCETADARCWTSSQSTYDNVPEADTSVRFVSPGHYEVRLPGDLSGGNVQVAGPGVADGVCKVAYWNPLDGVRVTCHDPAGNPPSAVNFKVSFVRPRA